ncbi:SDR family oxidoreductase [Actinoplanes sp. NPDC049265]|uniref:SDR family oxidoreductase n=1 Tax=Actinoplanes sp. NPDC049265 TaxID=3363902 RepID=UPI0037151D9F
MVTLVMGARGSVGKQVLDQLIARGVPVRASARRPKPGQFPPGVDVHAADLTDPASLTPAFDGVEQAFLYAHHDGVHDVVRAARAAGLRRIVLLSSGSVIHPTSKGNPITESHRTIESAFAEAPDLTVVPIRPLVLATNALAWAYSLKESGVVAVYRPDAMTAPIHEHDIAAVAVAALSAEASTRPHPERDGGGERRNGEDHASALLTGPARLSQRDQIAMIAAAAGRSIDVVTLTRDEAIARFERFMPATEAAAVVRFVDDAAAGNSPATYAVERILGRPPLPFELWAKEHAADFRS